MSEYADRDIESLDENGGYYFKHVMAMTSESLHSKSDIAAELGYRDSEIDRLTAENEALREEVGRLRGLLDDQQKWIDHISDERDLAERERDQLRQQGKEV